MHKKQKTCYNHYGISVARVASFRGEYISVEHKKYIKRKLHRFRKFFFKPAVLKRKEVLGTGVPRVPVHVSGNEPVAVCCADNVTAPADTFARIGYAWDRDFAGLFPPGIKILIKINLNTAAPYPASTSPDTAVALVDFLRAKGIDDITVGDCSGNHSLPTIRTARRNGILKALKGKAMFAFFDREPWAEVSLEGSMLGKVTVPRRALEADRLINLANLKTHCHADFSFGLKLAVGFMHPMERYSLHRDNLREKIAEINLAVPADLTIIDGRKAFITGGPDRGEEVHGDVMLVGKNPLAVDMQAYRVLYALKKSHGCLEGFHEDPLQMAQIRHARDIGIGGASWSGYSLAKI